MMGVAESGKCRILITMRFKVRQGWAPGNQNQHVCLSGAGQTCIWKEV